MHIQHIDPANMRGRAGAAIDQMHRYLRDVDGVFRSDIPDVRKSVIFSANATGEHVPKIKYLGSESLINKVMGGVWGKDYAQSIRNADPVYERAVSKGFAEAAAGHIVTEKVEMEVTPAGAVRPVFVSYYRIVSRLMLPPIWREKPAFILTSLTVATDDLVQHISRDRGYRLDG
jgi:hypothetical protein